MKSVRLCSFDRVGGQIFYNTVLLLLMRTSLEQSEKSVSYI